MEVKEVLDLIVGDGTKNLVDITIDGDVVTTTGPYPSGVDDQGRWVDAEDLQWGPASAGRRPEFI